MWKFVKFLPLFSSLPSSLLLMQKRLVPLFERLPTRTAVQNYRSRFLDTIQPFNVPRSGNRSTLKRVFIINCEWWANRGEQNGFMQIFRSPPHSCSLPLEVGGETSDWSLSQSHPPSSQLTPRDRMTLTLRFRDPRRFYKELNMPKAKDVQSPKIWLVRGLVKFIPAR